MNNCLISQCPSSAYRLDDIHMMSFSDKSRSAVSSTSSYSSESTYVGFSTGGTCMSGCFSQRTSSTGCLVFVQTFPRRRLPPPSFSVA